ncbi:helix-turn-helix domain-containing protein [Candidatus Absconditicoccus praedator]|uniref:helix-turn-helix domain-containing protein n=1 Tax=Candidatus Absconditicoccus praedator TaxID=2735562 RepID=UPI003B832D35|nr:helix-turn-helix domain-containing protein [Candidatus Absconditicoccus praedator]
MILPTYILKNYQKLKLVYSECIKIEVLLKQNYSKRQIAREINRSKLTISN